MQLGQYIPAGHGFARVWADLDFETFSAAGWVWTGKRWQSVAGKGKKGGLPAVGAAVYAEHPSTEVISMAYDLKDGQGKRLWLPGMAPPHDLFAHVQAGGMLEAFNSNFEWHIWHKVCHERMGWPLLPVRQLVDCKAKAQAWGLPGSLKNVGAVLALKNQKIEEGDALIKLFCVPRNPTLKNVSMRVMPADEPAKAIDFYNYNVGDIVTESEASSRIPDLSPDELEFFHLTQECNARGVHIDMETVDACIAILEQAYEKYDAETYALTSGAVTSLSQVQAITKWLNSMGIFPASLDDEHITALRERRPLPPHVDRVLALRQSVGSAGVKKVFSMKRRANRDNRLCDLFIYHGARTGRDTGADVQPQNLTKNGPALSWCGDTNCGKPYGQSLDACPYCGASEVFSTKTKWEAEAVDDTVAALRTRSLDYVERIYGDAVLAVSGCIRGLFTAAPGYELICSDYSSIEAVVTAALAGEQWRLDTFAREEDIYLVSAGRITGRTFEWYMANGGKKHPDRQYIGKPAELGLGFGGWLNAWRQFDKTDTFDDAAVKQNILAWRHASPAIVELWGGQVRGKPWNPDRFELYGLEGAAISAVLEPGRCFSYRLITYGVKDDVLYARLPSGRCLAYHKPRLSPSDRNEGQLSLSFEGWNSDPKRGKTGWIRMQTFGGRLTENCIAEGTEVLTNRGWVPIERVGASDLVHDGVEFVSHGGRLYKSVQNCVSIDGVFMTPDHEVLTHDGWQAASQGPRPYRPEIRGVNSPPARPPQREEKRLGVAVRLWDRVRKSRNRREEGRATGTAPELRVLNERDTAGASGYARDEHAAGLCSMAVNESPLYQPQAPGLAQLRRTGDRRLRRLARVVRSVLGRYGADVPARIRARPARQQRGVRSGQLPLGRASDQLEQSTFFDFLKHAAGAHDRNRSGPAFRRQQDDALLQVETGLARTRLAQVYDIVNAGPRQRFVVRGTSGPFIVHNCVQAVARDIMAHGCGHVERAGYPVVLRVHDELVSEVVRGYGSIAEYEKLMATLPPWAAGWPIRASGGWRGQRYKKD